MDLSEKGYNLEKDDVMKTSQNKKKTKFTKTRVKVAAWVLILLNILLLATLLILTIRWRSLRQSSLEPHEQTVCVKCTEMGFNINELSGEIEAEIAKDEHCNTTDCVCCGKTSVVLNRMIAKAIEESKTSTRSSLYPLVTSECKTTTEVKPSAQVNGVLIAETERGHGNIIHWNKAETSILTDLITYKHGKLTVKQPGYYYIFSQITFRHIPPSYNKKSAQYDTVSLYDHLPNHLDHFIYHISSETGKHEKILEGSKSRCEIPSTNDEIASSLGAVVYLAAGDDLFVKVSHPGLIAPNEERNHFGLYMT